VREQLELLVSLQELDNGIIALEDERNKIPDLLESLEDKAVTNEKRLEEVLSEIGSLDDEKTEKHRSVELERLRLKNTRNKESTIQNIKQYEAFVKEVETQEKGGDDLESELKEIAKRTEELTTEKKELEKAIESVRSEISQKYDELKNELKERDKELDGLYDKRNDLAEKIPESLYLKYERIAERKDDLAVAYVEHGHCMACNMAIPPQMFNELIKGDKLMACPACQRIIVYRAVEEEVAEEVAEEEKA